MLAKPCPSRNSPTQGTTLYAAVILRVRLFSKPHPAFLLSDRKTGGIELISLSSNWKSEKDKCTAGVGYLPRQTLAGRE